MPFESATVPAAVSLVNVFEENATVVAVNDGKVSKMRQVRRPAFNYYHAILRRMGVWITVKDYFHIRCSMVL